MGVCFHFCLVELCPVLAKESLEFTSVVCHDLSLIGPSTDLPGLVTYWKCWNHATGLLLPNM